MASALAVGNVAVLLSFSAQARGIQLYEVDCRHLMIRIPVVVRRNVSQNEESRAVWVTPMWLRIKMVFPPYVLNMQIAVFAFLREIMSPFDVKDARKRPHWWVSALLCYKPTNALRYWNSLLFRSGALYIYEHEAIQKPISENNIYRGAKNGWNVESKWHLGSWNINWWMICFYGTGSRMPVL